ncbi:type II secretion system protein, partial [Candidatus Gottesmanbacteria bacterium]|nr:type II secretion system protein [Candidatus Gottesmanbacteria bacterium]
MWYRGLTEISPTPYPFQRILLSGNDINTTNNQILPILPMKNKNGFTLIELLV